MSELSPEARALFRAARRAQTLPADARSRVRAGLEIQFASKAASTTHAGAWLLGGANVKPLAAVLVLLSSAWGVDSHTPRRVERAILASQAPTARLGRTASRSAATAPLPSAPSAPSRPLVAAAAPPNDSASPVAPLIVHAPPAVQGAATVRVHAPPSVRAPVSAPVLTLAASPSPGSALGHVRETPSEPEASVSPPAPSAQRLADEVRLVSSARAALRNEDASGALRALDEHASRFPDGVLTAEASAVRVLTLCALGRAREARDLAHTWLATTPRSPLASAVRRSCGGDGE